MDNKKIGLFIVDLRKKKNMTQKDLADKLYVSDKAVSKWERGLAMPDIGLIEKLAECLNVNVSEILKGERMDNMTINSSDEIMKDTIPLFQKEYFKKKKNRIILTCTVLIVALGTILYILGTVDYIRAMNGKKPIFVYHTVSALDPAVNIEGTDYYGIGYKISLCDNQNEKYIFQLGHKQKKLCYTNLTCTEDERGTLTLIDESTVAYVANDKHTYDFTFFDNRLYLINLTYLIPTSSIENEETWTKETLKYFDVPGVHTSIKKINGTTYEMKQSCNITEILMAGSKNVCSIDYFGEEIFGLRKIDILDQYHKDACK
jgi:transcriptional regulator with XRE-family HTH domain